MTQVQFRGYKCFVVREPGHTCEHFRFRNFDTWFQLGRGRRLRKVWCCESILIAKWSKITFEIHKSNYDKNYH